MCGVQEVEKKVASENLGFTAVVAEKKLDEISLCGNYAVYKMPVNTEVFSNVHLNKPSGLNLAVDSFCPMESYDAFFKKEVSWGVENEYSFQTDSSRGKRLFVKQISKQCGYICIEDEFGFIYLFLKKIS